MAVIDSYYSTSAFQPGPSALVTYFQAFVGERARMNEVARAARLKMMDPAALNDRMDTLQKTIAMLQGEKARIAREGLASRNDSLLSVVKNVGDIHAGSASAQASVYATRVGARTDLYQTAQAEKTRRMALLDPGGDAVQIIDDGIGRMVVPPTGPASPETVKAAQQAGASAALATLANADRARGATPGSPEAFGIRLDAYNKAASVKDGALQRNDVDTAARMDVLMQTARQQAGLADGETFEQAAEKYASQGDDEYKAMADWITRGGAGGAGGFMRDVAPVLTKLGLETGSTPEQNEVIKGIDAQISDIGRQLGDLEKQAAAARDPAAINRALFGDGTRNYILENLFARSHNGQGFVNAVMLLPKHQVKMAAERIDEYGSVRKATAAMEDPNSDEGGWGRTVPQFDQIPTQGTALVDILNGLVDDAMATKDAGGDPSVFLEEAMRILNTLPGSQRQLAQPVIDKIMDAHRKLTPREVKGTGGWLYKQESDGTITILGAPPDKSSVVGQILTPSGDKAAAYRAITNEIKEHEGNRAGVDTTKMLEDATVLAGQILGTIYTSDIVAAKVREAGRDAHKLDDVGEWLKTLPVQDAWTTSTALAIDTAIERGDGPALWRDMANVQNAADDLRMKSATPALTPADGTAATAETLAKEAAGEADYTQGQLTAAQDTVDRVVGQDNRPAPAPSAPARGVYGSPVGTSGLPMPETSQPAPGALDDAARGVPATKDAALTMPEAPGVTQMAVASGRGKRTYGGGGMMEGGAEVEPVVTTQEEQPPSLTGFDRVQAEVTALESAALSLRRSIQQQDTAEKRAAYNATLQRLAAARTELSNTSPPMP